MLDILREHLAQVATPELYSVLVQAHAAFERIGLANYEHLFEDLLTTSADATGGSQDLVGDSLELTEEYLRQILRDHGVICTEETRAQMLTALVNGLLDIQNYEDHQALKSTAQLEGESIEVLAELMALVTPYAVEALMTHFEEIDPALVRRIGELASEEADADEAAADFERAQYYNARLQKYLQLLGAGVQLDFVQLLKDGMRLGLPFELYLKRLGDRLPVYEPAHAAQELYAMATASRDGTNNPRAVIQQHLEHYVHDMGQITKIDMLVNDLLLKMSQQP